MSRGKTIVAIMEGKVVPLTQGFFRPHKQCAECPFKWDSTRGWFGPYRAKDYLHAAHGEAVVPCHMTTKHGDPNKLRHCTGVPLFRHNVLKTPRLLEQMEHQRKCVEKYGVVGVFKTSAQFLQHHTGPGSMNYLEEEET